MSASPGSFDSLDALAGAGVTDQVATDQPAAPFESQTKPAEVAWAVQGAPSLAEPAVYVTLLDSIKLTVFNGNTGLASVSAQLRLLLPDGTIQVSQLTLQNLTSDRTPNSVELSQVEGFLVSVVFTAPAIQVFRGQTFCRVDLVRGAPPSELTIMQLVADYLTTGFLPSWPFGVVKSSVEDSGYVYVNAPGPFAVGVQPHPTVPNFTRWRVASVSGRLTTSAVAGNRTPALIVGAGPVAPVNVLMQFPQAPSTVVIYTWGAAMPYSPAAAATETAPLPADLFLSEGNVINIFTTGFDASGDKWDQVGLVLEEWTDV